MEKIVFKHSWKSYLTVSLLGAAAGLLVAFFSQFPAHDLWGLAYFSSESFAFWILTSSLIALYSSRHYVAGISVVLYVYFMFYVTGIFKNLTTLIHGHSTPEFFRSGLWINLLYGLPYVGFCFALAFLLWFGRKNKLFFIMLRFAPLLFLLAEAIFKWFLVANRNQQLFMAIFDTLCAAAYLLIMLKSSDFKNQKQQ